MRAPDRALYIRFTLTRDQFLGRARKSGVRNEIGGGDLGHRSQYRCADVVMRAPSRALYIRFRQIYIILAEMRYSCLGPD